MQRSVVRFRVCAASLQLGWLLDSLRSQRILPRDTAPTGRGRPFTKTNILTLLQTSQSPLLAQQQKHPGAPTLWRMKMSIRLGEEAPDFTAETTEGTIRFHEWIGDH